MDIPVPIVTAFLAGGAAILIAFAGALFNLYSRLGRLEKGQEILEKSQENLASEIRAARDHFDAQLAAAEERALAREAAAEARALAREAAAEERAIARHNELLAEIRLWRTHGHDADGTIFFRVPE